MNNNFDFSQWTQWATKFFNPKELSQFQQIMAKFSPGAWAEYSKQWQEMFKNVEKHLNLDPKSKEAKSLYDQWMDLMNQIYGDYPDIKEKIWEAYKSGIKMNLEYFNQKVIDFIDQVGKFYNK